MADRDKPGKMKSKLKEAPKFVPYVRGFTPRPKRERMEAIGFDIHNIPLPYRPNPEAEYFTPLQRPTSVDDWLAQYHEDGQTFRGFLWQSPWMTNRCQRNMKQTYVQRGKTLSDRYPEGKIYIVPVGKFDESYIKFDDLVDYTRKFLCLPVTTAEGLQLEQDEGKIVLLEDSKVKSEIETRYSAETKHLQIGIRSILPELKEKIPKDALCVIGLTMYDLYGDDTDLFMAGLAAWNENVAIFSIHRYDPRLTFSTEFWYDIKPTEEVSDEDRKRLVLQRSCKLVVHEINHLLGIDHCVYFDCCMNGSGHLAEDFRQPMHLCPVDLHKLQVLTGFDVTERYQKLLEFYKKHGMETEADWVERRLRFIQGKAQNKKGKGKNSIKKGKKQTKDS